MITEKGFVKRCRECNRQLFQTRTDDFGDDRCDQCINKSEKVHVKLFRILDPETGFLLAGFLDVERGNAVFGYGKPASKDFKHIDNLECGEFTQYVFTTGAGKTYGKVLRVK